MKRKIVVKNKSLIFLLGILLLVSVGGTFAYFYKSVILPTQFKSMTYNVSLTEEFNNTWGTKKVYITNNETSNKDVVLRINYSEVWIKSYDGQFITLSNTINGTNVVNKVWTEEFTNNFVDGQDGWYYYKKVLSTNSSVQILDSISLNSTLIQQSANYNDYLTYDYHLNFGYEALEATSDLISSIWNKSATISGSDVVWN